MRTRLLRFPQSAVLAGIVLAAGAVAAQDYPSRPIRLIIPYGTGGITDITARIVAPRMSDNLGQQVVVENRPGGAAIPGFDLVAKARPDGYIAVLATTALAANPILFRKLPYDAQKDFAPVSLNAWLGILVPAGTPVNVIDRLHAATVAALQRPEVSERLISLGLEPVGSTPAQLGAHLKSEMARWFKLAREVKFEVAD